MMSMLSMFLILNQINKKTMNLFGVIAIIVVALLGYFLGRRVQKEIDKPVLILDENTPHAKQFLHHIHPHDQKELGG